MNEAGRLLDEGASIEAIDKALVDFGFPVGPITLLDEVGIDVGGKVGLVLSEAFGARMAPSEAMRRVVAAGRTGRKGGKRVLPVRRRREEGRRRRRRSTRSSAASSAREIAGAGDRRALRAGDGERGGALPGGRDSPLAARRRHRRGVRDRVPAVSRRPVPLRRQRRRATDRRTVGGSERPLSRAVRAGEVLVDMARRTELLRGSR